MFGKLYITVKVDIYKIINHILIYFFNKKYIKLLIYYATYIIIKKN